jgi:ribosomal protein S18 acetylase RimI-like enzyme
VAAQADAARVAAFHVKVWRETYAGIAPAELFAILDVAWRLPTWQASLRDPAQGCVLALAGAEIAGLVSYGPAGHPAFDGRGEVKHLYVDAAFRKQGVARALLGHAFGALRVQGYTRFGLAVVAQNTAARAAYAGLGGVEAGHFTDAGPTWKSDNILVVWDGV